MTDEVRSKEIVLKELGEAYKKGDMKAVSKLASEIAKIDALAEATEKAAKVKALEEIGAKVKAAIMKAVQKFIDAGDLDVADGVWFSYDFTEKLETIRLMKGAAKKEKGTGSGSSGYVSIPDVKTADLLAEVGDHIMFKADTVRKIDKVEHTMPAGMTFKEAFEFSNNGGWRNSVRMALLKEAGKI